MLQDMILSKSVKLSEGTLFAEKYELIKQLGRGGFSEVWLARYTVADGLPQAIKIYAPGMGLDMDGQKMFIDEFSLVENLRHTNLLCPRIIDVWNNMPYLVLPYCKNGSAFSRYVAGHRRITEEESWKMLHDVAAGLAYLHEKEPPIIHQDIKPDNILIDDEERYVISDFGISSKVQSTIRKNKNEELSGGTFAYMAPERFSASPKPIMASDIWALGAMMYELMMGVPPFGNHGGVLQKNGAEIPIIEGDYSQELKDLVYSCLAKDAWDRPNSHALAELTNDYLHGITSPTTIVKKPVPPTLPQNSLKSIMNGFVKQLSELWDNKDKRKWLIGSVAAVGTLLVLLLATCGDTKEETVVEPIIVDTTAKYDSIARVQLKQTMSLKEAADRFSVAHKENLFDETNGHIESRYLEVQKQLNQIINGEYRDSISKDMYDLLVTRKQEITGKLDSLHIELLKMANELKSIDVSFATPYEQRAKELESYIGK